VSVGGSVTLNTFDLTLAPGDSFRSAAGAFIEDQIALTSRLTWTIGTRLDKFDTFAATLSPRTSLVFRPTRKQALRVAVNRAYRAPSLIETFASTTIDNVIPIVPGLPPVVFSTLVTGNRQLDPEVGRAVEVGLTSEVGARASVSASAYYNSTNGFVRFYETESYGPNAPPPGWPLPVEFVPAVPRTLTWLNVGSVRNRGIELTGRVELARGISTRASYTFQDAPKATGADPRYPLQLNRQPKNMASAGLIYQGKEWNGSVDTSYVGAAYWSDVLDARFWGTTSSFVLLNAKVAYPLPGVRAQLALSGTNLLDRRIKQHVFGDIYRRHVSAELEVKW
jgi:outer membrane receptor protein involved in Fe transport